MHEDELAFICSSGDHNDKGKLPVAKATEIATLCWCAKETAYKALGETAVDFSEHFCIEPFEPLKEGILLLHEKRTEQKRRFSITYRITEDFILTMYT
jgi:4'-phosphopantetheinyl transferase EntD